MEDLTKFPVEYDFKTLKIDLIDKKTGKIKERYKCLGYMITFPLVQSLIPDGALYQEIPIFNSVKLFSNKQVDGYLNFNIPLINDERSIITTGGYVLKFNYYDYYYNIKIKMINPGDVKDVKLRCVSYYTYNSKLVSNLNDIYGNETVSEFGKDIEFIVTGHYNNFIVYYPNNNFEISMEITVSDKKPPVFICNKKCCTKCKCFEINNLGYIKIKTCDKKYVNVPVYKKLYGNSIETVLYPSFYELRKIYLRTTELNSLFIPKFPFPTNEIMKLKNQTDPVTVYFYPNGVYDGRFTCSDGVGPILFTENPPDNLNMPIEIITKSGECGGKPWAIHNMINPDEGGYIECKWDSFVIWNYEGLTTDLLLRVKVSGGEEYWTFPQTSDQGVYDNYVQELNPNYLIENFKGGSFKIPLNYKYSYLTFDGYRKDRIGLPDKSKPLKFTFTHIKK